MGHELDRLDLEIIHELHKEGRISLIGLAEKTGVPRQTVTNRLRQLIDEGLVLIKGGLDIRKLGYKISEVGLEIRGEQARREIERYLKDCPRVLNIFRTPGKANFHIRVWGEEDRTINSTIESFGDIQNVDIIYTNYLGTPTFGDIIIDAHPKDLVKAPCGMVCEDCTRYHNDLCTGCPTTKYYKNPLSSESRATRR